MKIRKTDLLEGSIALPILAFFFPILLGTFFQQLYNTIDAMVVGNFVSKEALSAVGGTTGTLINLLVGFITGISSGATVVVAQYYGNHEYAKTKRAVASAMFLGIVLGAVMSIIGIAFAPQLLRLMNVPEDVYLLSVRYMRYYLLGLIPAMIYNTGAGILRASGDARRPLYFLIVSCLVNIVLDGALVIWLPWGVVGAAVATTASQVVSAWLTLRVLAQTSESYNFHLREISFDADILKRIIVIGLPTGFQSCLYSFANVFIQSSVNRYGVDTMAAYTVFGKIDSLYWMTSGAFGTAVLTFCGQNFGAHKIDRVKRGFHISLLLDFGISIFIAGGLYFGCPALFALFTNDALVIEIGVDMLRYLCPWWLIFIFIEVFSSGIRSCGDSFMPMLITALGVGAFRIVWLLFYPAVDVKETLRCYPISWFITAVLLSLYYLQGGWLKRSLKAREKLMANM